MSGYGLHQHQFGLTQQHMQQDSFATRRPVQDPLSLNHGNARTAANLTSPPQVTNPWLHPYQNQQNTAISPDFNMSIPNMFHSRWEQSQQASLIQQREMQIQREEQLYRERHLQQMQQERDAQLQQEKEILMQKEKERKAQLQREKEAQLQREREAQLQREREAQLQREREHEVQLQRERELQMQRERDLQLRQEHERQIREMQQREREQQEKQAQMMRETQAMREAQLERKPMYYREPFFQSQQHVQQYSNYFSSTQGMLPNLNFTQPNDPAQQHYNYYNPHANIGTHMNQASNPPSNIFGNYTSSQLFNQAKLSESPPPVSKQMHTSSSLHFPQPSPVASTADYQWSTTNSTTNTIRKSSNSFDNGIINSIVSDKGFLTSPLDSNSQFMQTWTDIADMDLAEIESNVLGPKDKETPTSAVCETPSDVSSSRTSDSFIGQISKPNDSTINSISSLPENSIQFNSLPVSQKEDDINLKKDPTPQQQEKSSEMSLPTQSVSFSQVSSQSNSVNININITMPNHSSNTQELSEAVVSKAKSSIASVLSPTLTNHLSNTPQKDGETVFIPAISTSSSVVNNQVDRDGFGRSNSFERSISSTLIPPQRQKSKQSYSSIESFLGMSNEKDSTEESNTKAEESNDLDEINANTLDKQDRISVIKSLPVLAQNYNGDAKDADEANEQNEEHTQALSNVNEIEQDVREDSSKINQSTEQTNKKAIPLLHPSMRMKRQRSLSSSNQPAQVTLPKETSKQKKTGVKDTKKSSSNKKLSTPGRPMHPSMRLSSNTKNPDDDTVSNESLDDSYEEKGNMLRTSKAARYQSELKTSNIVEKSKPPKSLSIKSSQATSIKSPRLTLPKSPQISSVLSPQTPSLKSPKLRSPIPGGKPFHSGKPIHGGKPVHGGKPTSYSIQSGGKPASYSSHLSTKQDSPTEESSYGKQHTGKPLSFLKSMMENSQPPSTSVKDTKQTKTTGRKRTRKEASVKIAKKGAVPNMSVNKTPTSKTDNPKESQSSIKLNSPPSTKKVTPNSVEKKLDAPILVEKKSASPKSVEKKTKLAVIQSKATPQKKTPQRKPPANQQRNAKVAKRNAKSNAKSTIPKEIQETSPKTVEEKSEEKTVTVSSEEVQDSPKKTFQFKEITFDDKQDKESSDSGSDSSSDSDDSDDSHGKIYEYFFLSLHNIN